MRMAYNLDAIVFKFQQLTIQSSNKMLLKDFEKKIDN